MRKKSEKENIWFVFHSKKVNGMRPRLVCHCVGEQKVSGLPTKILKGYIWLTAIKY